MDINKKSRTELKAYFVKNAIPTQSNFSDFIDAGINQKDDGITKSAGSPLSVEASNTGERPALHIYDSFASQVPNWVVSLLPGTTSGGKTIGKGLGIGDGAGAARAKLFLEDATGNLAIGTVDPAGFKLNLAGTLNVTGAVTANAGITVSAAQALVANGPLNANAGATVSGGVLTANSGITVPTGQTLTANGPLNANAGATVAGGPVNANAGLNVAAGQNLNANGPLNANSGATVSGAMLTANAGLTVAANQTLTANGPVNANAGVTVTGGALTAKVGAAITGGGLTVGASGAAQPLDVWGALTARAGATVSGGLLTANSGLTIPTGQTLTANGPLNATAGATVSGALLNANAGATISGALLTANAGATVAGGVLNANGGLTVPSGQTLTINGTLSANNGGTVTGTLQATTYVFPPPTGDPSPVITARTVPAGQGAANEVTELILFHSNDNGTNGSGPDLITLRAPGIRLQTYADTSVTDINNAAGSNTRLYIDPTGPITTYSPMSIGVSGTGQPLDVYGTLTARADAKVNTTLTVVGTTTQNSVAIGTPTDYVRAQFALCGGGTVLWGGPGGRLKWTAPFYAIAIERGVTFAAGQIYIGASSGAPAVTQAWDGATRDSTIDGVVLNAWEALYAVHTPGGAAAAVTLQVANYTSTFRPPSNWVLLAVVNGDDKTVKLGTGQVVAANAQISYGALVPSGTIVMYGKTQIPGGWVICDGTNGTPDLRDRFIVGAGNSYAIGNTGGEATHTLTVNEMPSHAHQALGGGIDDLNFTGGNMYNGERIPFTRSDGNTAGVETTRNTGGGAAHENRPPYYALYYIMKL